MPLDMDARWRGLLRWLPGWSIYGILRLLLIAALVIQVARLGWALVTPPGMFGDWRASMPMPRDPARAVLGEFDPFFRLDKTVAPATGVVTNLQLTLFGTRLDEAMGRGSAIIATPDGEQKSYAVGDEIIPGVTLKEVAFDHVTIDRGGTSEDLFINQSPSAGSGPATAPADDPVADSQELAPAPVDKSRDGSVSVADLRAAIGFIPRIDDGRLTGLVVRQQGGSDIFQRIGFHSGDVIVQINGHPVTSADDLSSLAGGMANGGNLSVSVERGAEILPLVINVKGK